MRCLLWIDEKSDAQKEKIPHSYNFLRRGKKGKWTKIRYSTHTHQIVRGLAYTRRLLCCGIALEEKVNLCLVVLRSHQVGSFSLPVTDDTVGVCVEGRGEGARRRAPRQVHAPARGRVRRVRALCITRCRFRCLTQISTILTQYSINHSIKTISKHLKCRYKEI